LAGETDYLLLQDGYPAWRISDLFRVSLD